MPLHGEPLGVPQVRVQPPRPEDTEPLCSVARELPPPPHLPRLFPRRGALVVLRRCTALFGASAVSAPLPMLGGEVLRNQMIHYLV
jgi:hypothetical protein